MTTTSDRLRNAKANYAAKLEEISRNPRPNYNVEGQSYSWEGYQRMLLDAMDKLDALIDRAEDDGGITEEITELY